MCARQDKDHVGTLLSVEYVSDLGQAEPALVH